MMAIDVAVSPLRRLLLAVALVVCVTAVAAATIAAVAQLAPPSDDDAMPSDYRLPSVLRPYLYELALHVHFDPHAAPADDERDAPFAEGRVRIHATCTRPTTIIYLHAHELAFDAADVQLEAAADGARLALVVLERLPAVQQLRLHFAESLDVGRNYTLTIAYRARIADAETGGLYMTGRPRCGECRVRVLARAT